jgi:RNA polymerase sigma factor (sigma-70 family)
MDRTKTLTGNDRQQRFVEWAETYNNLLWKVARSFASGADQDDLHQELLLALWQAIPAFRGEAAGSTFVYRVAYNHALTWVRKRRPAEVALHQAREPVSPDTAANDEEAQLELMYRHIRALPPVDRTLVLLYLDEVPYREMAEILGLTESNVGVRLNRVKKQLAEQINEVSRA